MSDAERKLADALRALRPAPRDPAFRLAVLERMAHRRLRVRLAWLCGAGAALVGSVLVTAPLLARTLGPVETPEILAAFTSGGAIALIGWSVTLMRRPI